MYFEYFLLLKNYAMRGDLRSIL